MTQDQDAIASAAEAIIGSPFRLHGRSPKTGLDCVGLVAHALGQINRKPLAIPAYNLRNTSYDFVPQFAQRNGFPICNQPVRRGDLIAVCPGPAQLHLLIASGTDSFIHAHAGLRKVVAVPNISGWSIIHQFRLEEEA